MQKKHIRKFIPLLVILLLVGCWLFNEFVIRRPAGKTVVAEFENYMILKTEDQYYLRMDDSKYVIKDSSGNKLPQKHAIYSPPEFRSAQDMRDSILKGKLTEHNLGYIWQEFSWDGHGDYLIPDPYNITIPEDPYGTLLKSVSWAEDHLLFYYTNSIDQRVSINCYPLNKEHDVRSQFNEYLELQKEFICQTEQIDDRNATVYYAQYEKYKSKYIIYDLSTEGKQLVIFEHYSGLEKFGKVDSGWDNPVPDYTEFCGIENGTFFTGRIYTDNNLDYGNRPSIKFLQSLGISPEPAR